MADESSAGAERGGSFRLNLTNRSVTRPIGSAFGDPDSAKFVEIDVAEVSNPKKIRLAFEVLYGAGKEGKVEKRLLGTFGLYPPDRPGKFLVATRGGLRRGGAIVLSMQVLDEVKPEDRVEVTVSRISLRKE